MRSWKRFVRVILQLDTVNIRKEEENRNLYRYANYKLNTYSCSKLFKNVDGGDDDEYLLEDYDSEDERKEIVGFENQTDQNDSYLDDELNETKIYYCSRTVAIH
jgi:hypothetical protein